MSIDLDKSSLFRTIFFYFYFFLYKYYISGRKTILTSTLLCCLARRKHVYVSLFAKTSNSIAVLSILMLKFSSKILEQYYQKNIYQKTY